MIVSEGLKVSSTEPGTTYLEDFSGILGKITSENQEEQAMAQV